MIWLAENYVMGIVVACIIVILLYVGVSLVGMFSAREEGLDVCVSAMIPIWNIVILIRTRIHKQHRKQKLEINDSIELF